MPPSRPAPPGWKYPELAVKRASLVDANQANRIKAMGKIEVVVLYRILGAPIPGVTAARSASVCVRPSKSRPSSRRQASWTHGFWGAPTTPLRKIRRAT